MIEDVVKGSDGLIRAANIRTKPGKTNCPVARLYPLEVCSTETLKLTPTIPQPSNGPPEDQIQSGARQTRNTALKARLKLHEWTQILRAPLEDIKK